MYTSFSNRPSQSRFSRRPASAGGRPSTARFGGRGAPSSRPYRGGRPPMRRGRGPSTESKLHWYSKSSSESQTPTVEVARVGFDTLGLSPTMMTIIKEKGFELATPIQGKTIPLISGGADVVGIAQTGTGKTGAFLIPIIERIIRNEPVKALIVVPTRELATQVSQEFMSLTRPHIFVGFTLVIGGAPMYRQIMSLRRGTPLVVGTPGRLKDLIEQGELKLQDFNTIVLDEVDRMLDMGFVQDVKYLISRMSAKRQSLFFSATMNPAIQEIIRSFAPQAQTVQMMAISKPSERVSQRVVHVEGGQQKHEILHDMIKTGTVSKAIVFVRTKHGVDRLARRLFELGHHVSSIHGDKMQRQRDRALSNFKGNNTRILIATDVVARGIDVPDITHVVNFDEPESYDDYIHRIGRAGRGEHTGEAITLIGGR